MQMIDINGVTLHYSDQGPKDGAPLVFANSLGTDYRLWDQIMPLLPDGLRVIRYDKRGHGLSSGPDAPYFMGDLVADLAGLMDALAVRNAVLVGLSIGGMIAQGLAAERPDLLKAMVLSNTGAKIGNEAIWDERIKAARKGGIDALAEAQLRRWFSQGFRENRPEEFAAWSAMLRRTWIEGFIGCSAAIAETDLYDSTARLSLPTLGIASSEDGSTPPDMVRETTELVPNSQFKLIRGAGHLPCVEKPEEYAAILTDFLQQVGHI
ncbi:MAG: 3-oxoadipate enol-lactonase [Alphaproteobacteria bacterium]|nr:3-oxoadipate enol-lactonase [Alphaproteobacteria bacterium]